MIVGLYVFVYSPKLVLFLFIVHQRIVDTIHLVGVCEGIDGDAIVLPDFSNSIVAAGNFLPVVGIAHSY